MFPRGNRCAGKPDANLSSNMTIVTYHKPIERGGGYPRPFPIADCAAQAITTTHSLQSCLA